MRIGIAGPVTLDLLRGYFPASCSLPRNYPFAMTAGLASELMRRGHEVVVYTTSTEIQSSRYFPGSPLTVCISPSSPRHRGKTLFRGDIAGLAQSLRAYPCDVLHAHWTYEFGVAAIASGIPTLITVHDAATKVLLQFRDAYRAARWLLNAYTLRRAKYLSVVSPYIYWALRQSARTKTVVIPNFIPEHLAARTVAYDRRENYIISVSHGFNRLKNLSTALLAFRDSRRGLGGAKYLLAGYECEPGGAAQRFCEEHGCLEDVVFCGAVPHDRLLELVANASAMLHPSLEESFGMSVLEAMALGTPAIAGDRSGNLPHLIEHQRTGILCDVTRAEAIGQALRALMQDWERRAVMGAAAQRQAFEKYSASAVVDQYLSAYGDVLAGNRRPRHIGSASTASDELGVCQ